MTNMVGVMFRRQSSFEHKALSCHSSRRGTPSDSTQSSQLLTTTTTTTPIRRLPNVTRPSPRNVQAMFGAWFQVPKVELPPPPPQQYPKFPSPFPYLPLDILRRILHLGGLRSKDILAVAATCRPLYRCAPMAYNSLHFPLNSFTGTARGMHALLHTLQLLMETIYGGQGYPTQIFRITFFAARHDLPQSGATQVEQTDNVFAQALRDVDFILAQLFELATNLRTFVLDASEVGRVLAFPTTLSALAHDRTRAFSELALVRVCTGIAANVNAPHVPGSLDARRVTIRSEDLHLVRAFLGAPVEIRSLDFRENVATFEPWVALLNGGFHHEGHARDVERLILTCGGKNQHFEDHTEFVRLALVSTCFSVNPAPHSDHHSTSYRCSCSRGRASQRSQYPRLPS